MKNLVQLRSLLRHQRQWRCLQSFGMWQNVQVLRTLPEQLRTLGEEVSTLEEEEQTEEFAVRALKILALRALPRSLAVRALKEKHLTCEQAS